MNTNVSRHIQAIKALFATAILLGIVSSSRAVPPALPDKAELVDGSDFIAIVTITNVEEKILKRRPTRVVLQTAHPVIERILKGSAPNGFATTYTNHLSITCRPAPIERGRYLVFLRKASAKKADVYDRTMAWHSIVPITNNQVDWWDRMKLDDAVREIEIMAKIR